MTSRECRAKHHELVNISATREGLASVPGSFCLTLSSLYLFNSAFKRHWSGTIRALVVSRPGPFLLFLRVHVPVEPRIQPAACANP